MDYKLFNAEEFAADESFISYYLKKNPQDIAYWSNWISRHPEKLDEIINAERLLAIVYLRATEQEQEDALTRFNDFISENEFVHHEQSYADQTGRVYHRSFNFRMAAIAASLIFLLSMGGLYFYHQPASQVNTEYVTVRNDYGLIRKISLADGTQVSLNANSSLTYPKIFDKQRRDVSLSGEAFFEVAKDKKRPFTVNANGTTTRVLGTKFNVNAYTAQKTVVALVEGSVAFNPVKHTSATAGKASLKGEESADRSENQSSTAEIILKPSDMITYTKNNGQMQLTSFNVKNVTAWTSGIVLFSNASFEDIAAKFQNTYGIELKDHTRAGKWNYSGQFTRSDYLTIIKSICFAKNLHYKQTHHTITLINN